MAQLPLFIKFRFFIIIGMMLACGQALASQETAIDFVYPVYQGDFYVSGKPAFAPGIVGSENNIIVIIKETGIEADTRITAQGRWPDGTLSSAQVTFAANRSRPAEYMLCYGPDIRRKKIIRETAVLPTIPFALAGTPRQRQNMDVTVGQINVRVDKSPDIAYYWYVVPMLALIGLSVLRSRRVCK